MTVYNIKNRIILATSITSHGNVPQYWSHHLKRLTIRIEQIQCRTAKYDPRTAENKDIQAKNRRTEADNT